MEFHEFPPAMKGREMKAIATAALAVLCFAGFAHSAESTVGFETAVEVADTTSYAGSRCILWNDRYVCSI